MTPAAAAAVAARVARPAPPPGVSNHVCGPGEAATPSAPWRLSAEAGGGAMAAAASAGASRCPAACAAAASARSTVFDAPLRALFPPPPGEASSEAYRFMGEPPEKLESSGLLPPAIIVDSAPSGDAPVSAPRAPGEPPGSMDSKSSVMGKGERGAPCPPCSAPMPCMGAPPRSADAGWP